MSKTKDGPVEITQLPAETLRVPVVGTTPLITNRFSEKAKRQMLDNMQGRKPLKQARDPQADYEGAFYYTKSGQPGLPATAFKAATVSAGRFYSVHMTTVRQSVFISGEPGDDGQLLAVISGEPQMREDTVGVGISGHDLRYRPEFPDWSVDLEVTYITSMLTRGSLLSLIDGGGMAVGVGDWRPQTKGMFGTYKVDPTREVEVISGGPA